MVILILLISLFAYLPSETNSAQPVKESMVKHDSDRSLCSQRATEKERLIREAEKNRYTLRRIMFVGNTYTQDQVLRDRMELLQEGNVFTRESLIKSLESVSQLKDISPVKMKDLAVHLNVSTKEIDINICFKQKPR